MTVKLVYGFHIFNSLTDVEMCVLLLAYRHIVQYT